MGVSEFGIATAAHNAGRASPSPAAPRASMSAEQLRDAARDFEAFFLARALEPMFAGIGAEAPFGGGMAEELWRSLLVDEYGKAMAKAGGIGLADTLLRGLIDLQEIRPPSAPGQEPHARPTPTRPGLAHTEIDRP